MENYIEPVDPKILWRTLNIGGTVLVSTAFEGKSDVMAAGWNSVVDFDKAMVIIDKTHYTRPLIEKGEYFALQLPLATIAPVVMNLGSVSKNDEPAKLEKSGAEFFTIPGYETLPLVKGCAAWLIFRHISEPHNEQAYDMFIGQCVGAWSDTRVFAKGHWHFETAGEDCRTLHYVSGGHFYKIGEPLTVPGYDE
ncbi:MAG TPA: flavin reductase [Sutterella sp.]|nr:flavin reductase [Sutterella sp.]